MDTQGELIFVSVETFVILSERKPVLINLGKSKTKTKGFISPFTREGWGVVFVWHI